MEGSYTVESCFACPSSRGPNSVHPRACNVSRGPPPTRLPRRASAYTHMLVRIAGVDGTGGSSHTNTHDTILHSDLHDTPGDTLCAPSSHTQPTAIVAQTNIQLQAANGNAIMNVMSQDRVPNTDGCRPHTRCIEDCMQNKSLPDTSTGGYAAVFAAATAAAVSDSVVDHATSSADSPLYASTHPTVVTHSIRHGSAANARRVVRWPHRNPLHRRSRRAIRIYGGITSPATARPAGNSPRPSRASYTAACSNIDREESDAKGEGDLLADRRQGAGDSPRSRTDRTPVYNTHETSRWHVTPVPTSPSPLPHARVAEKSASAESAECSPMPRVDADVSLQPRPTRRRHGVIPAPPDLLNGYYARIDTAPPPRHAEDTAADVAAASVSFHVRTAEPHSVGSCASTSRNENTHVHAAANAARCPPRLYADLSCHRYHNPAALPRRTYSSSSSSSTSTSLSPHLSPRPPLTPYSHSSHASYTSLATICRNLASSLRSASAERMRSIMQPHTTSITRATTTRARDALRTPRASSESCVGRINMSRLYTRPVLNDNNSDNNNNNNGNNSTTHIRREEYEKVPGIAHTYAHTQNKETSACPYSRAGQFISLTRSAPLDTGLSADRQDEHGRLYHTRRSRHVAPDGDDYPACYSSSPSWRVTEARCRPDAVPHTPYSHVRAQRGCADEVVSPSYQRVCAAEEEKNWPRH